MLKGIQIRLSEISQTGIDSFNRPITIMGWTNVENVLVYPASEQEILDTLNLTGRKAVYNLCIPKGDQHDWENQMVQFWGMTWRTIGKPKEYIEDLIPLSWNKQIRVESLNGE